MECHQGKSLMAYFFPFVHRLFHRNMILKRYKKGETSMEKMGVNVGTGKLVWIVKSLFAAYLTTIILLLLLAFGLYKLDLSEQAVQGGITAIYVLSAFIGGRVAGKLAKNRRFFWGLIVGVCYFLLLVVISVLAYRSTPEVSELAVSILLCLAGGMLGGMLS